MENAIDSQKESENATRESLLNENKSEKRDIYKRLTKQKKFVSIL